MTRFIRWGLLSSVLAVLFSVALASPAYQETSPENVFQVFLRDLRTDIETLADRVFPGAQRPENWIGNEDYTSQNMVADLFVDNELLADTIFGEGTRPPEWIGITTSLPDLVVRNIRHDLELSATTQLGDDLRPDDWVGAQALFSCDRTLMNTVYLLETGYGIASVTPDTVIDYCAALATEVTDDLIVRALGPQQLESVPAKLLAVRGDLERLRDEVLGVNVRPVDWVGNLDEDSPAFIADLDSDLELLADIILDNQRPNEWVTVGLASESAALRNLRFNLETLTDRALGITVRPNGWQGETDLIRCAPDTQNLVGLVQGLYPYDLPDDNDNVAEFCALARLTANIAAENPPPPEILDEVEAEEEALRYTAESRNAFSYLDQAAVEYMGVLPWGTSFRAWYRNFGGSTMMFVSGDDFAIFIDRRWTTMSQEVFDALPTLEGREPLTFCDAAWCNGPAPTPTPTGSGPILDIINLGTQPAESAPIVTPDADTGGLELVSWNHLKVTYEFFREDEGTAQVTIQLCRTPNQVICEPAISVYNTALSQGLPVISQKSVNVNGEVIALNVYELPYGYSNNIFLIEGETLYSRDIWLNDPSLVTNP